MINRLIRFFSGRDPEPVAGPGPVLDEQYVEARIMARLLDVLRAGDAERALAEAALRREADSVFPSQWPRTDAILRGWRYLGYYTERPDAATPVRPGSAAAEVLASHGDGFVRAEMVARLAEQRDGRELWPLLLRAKDWVPQVRDAARAALRDRLLAGYEEHWMRNLALVLWAGEGERADAGLAAEVMALVRASPRGEEMLTRGLHSGERAVRHAAFAALTDVGGPELAYRLETVLLRSDDVAVRRRAAAMVATLEDEDARRLHAYLRLDRAAVIRARGLELAVRVATDPEWMLREGLVDRSAMVRQTARFHLKTVAPLDVAAFYRERITADHPQLAVAVAGLGETGTAADFGILSAQLNHRSAAVRRAAVRAPDRLAGGSEVEVFLAALNDASGGVSRQAVEALRSRRSLVPAGRLAALAEADEAHVRRNAFRLLQTGPAWSAIVWILRGCADDDPRIALAAQNHLRRWRPRLNRTAAQPSMAQKLAAREAMNEAGDRIPPSMKDWLHFVLR
ncbi:hypothetical protein [Longimicrobium terrae]|uniref:HEAT repeat protein n=1 Tax=Longimicrobium terrae TaxID=1639882 RepID=A0A841H1A9_9BACT|nr:hypothetical protein [Longimicrobium terrae]MBB4637392.1 HEAT repeat protein [Longimicrobium terrae]MBB6071790.1 HEAT repeat protein [Longimicrobium terrae]NNC28550.1 hypothetical protein [Longimicrobium terrae]